MRILAPLITVSALALVIVVAGTIPFGLASDAGANQLSAYAYADADTSHGPYVYDEDSEVSSCPGPATARAIAKSQGTCGECRATGDAASHAAGTPPNVATNRHTRVDAWVRRGHNGWAHAHAHAEEDPVVEAGGSYTIQIQLGYGIQLRAEGEGAVKASCKITVKQGGKTIHYGEAIFEAGVLTINPSPPIGAGLLWTSADWAEATDRAVLAARTISKTVNNAPTVYVRTELSAEVPSQEGSAANGYASARTTGPVGGIAFPVDELALLAPWIFLGVSVAAITVGTIYSRKRWLGRAAALKP